MTAPGFDPITLEVIRHRLDTVAEEMETVLLKSSCSPLVKEGLDASASLFTLDARDKERAEANFLECGEVLRSGVPVYRLAYARKAALLDDVCRAVLQCLGSEAPCLA